MNFKRLIFKDEKCARCGKVLKGIITIHSNGKAYCEECEKKDV